MFRTFFFQLYLLFRRRLSPAEYPCASRPQRTRKLNNWGMGAFVSINVVVLASRRDEPGDAALETHGYGHHLWLPRMLALLSSIHCTGLYPILSVAHVLRI